MTFSSGKIVGNESRAQVTTKADSQSHIEY